MENNMEEETIREVIVQKEKENGMMGKRLDGQMNQICKTDYANQLKEINEENMINMNFFLLFLFLLLDNIIKFIL